MEYTRNYNLRKPEDTDPADIQDLNYNADVIDGKLKEIEDWETAHLQASNPHSITPALIGAETPTGAQQKANQAETNAKSYADIVTNNALDSAKDYADTAANSALNNAKDYADTAANSALNNAKDYADDVLESANSHTDQVASDLSQKLNETRIKVLDVEQDVFNISKVLTNLNPNQEATQKASGYGIISLPKNAANGQVSVTLKGNTYFNSVINGNFAQGITGWRGNAATISAVNNILSVTGDGTATMPNVMNASSYRTIIGRTGKKIFLRAKVRVTNSVCNSIALYVVPSEEGVNILYAKNIANPVQNQWYDMFGIVTLTAGYENKTVAVYVRHVYQDTATVNGKIMEVREILAIDLDQHPELANLTADQINARIPYWFDGTKSTVSAIRLKSVNEDESKESTLYILGKDKEGNILELRSLPNGTKDEIRVSGGKAELVKRVGKTSLKGNEPWGNIMINEDNYQSSLVNFVNKNNVKLTSFNFSEGAVAKNELAEFNQVPTGINNAAYQIQFNSSNYNLYLTLPKSVVDTMVGTTILDKFKAYLNQYPVTLTYQLAKSEIIPIEVSGSLVSYPNGTIYVEKVVPDAGIYADGITVLHSDLPIKEIEKLSKIDFTTGLETELDPSDCIISDDKLSFTHPELQDGDIVFFTYFYDVESTEGELELEYYDSRYVIQDSVTGKFYKWKIAVANGTPTIELEEV